MQLGKWFSHHPRVDSMLFRATAPALLGCKWARGTNKSEKEHVRFGDTGLAVLPVRPQQRRYKINSLADELGLLERE
jgi:hypothetical protein